MTQGRIFARVAWVNGRTRLVEHRQNAPLKIARCFETEGRGLEICVMDASPGLLAGDCADYEWIVEAGAKLRVTAQGATRIHPSSGPISRQNVRFHVAADARLELWPQSVIPFRATRFQATTTGHLEAGAELLLLDSLSSGRVARGESFAFTQVSNRTLLLGARGPLLCTQNRFIPAQQWLQNPLSWGDFTQLTNVFAFGFGDETTDQQGATVAHEVLSDREASGEVRGSVSSLARGGLAVSLQGRRAYDTHRLARLIARSWRSMGFGAASLGDVNA